MRVFLFLITVSLSLNAQKQSIDYVNMMVGSTGEHSTEYGGTTPAVSEPFGMTQWCAATRINGISRTMYHYEDPSFIGFMATHQPAVWMGDYGFFTLMPQMDKLEIEPEKRKVKLNRENEVSTPYYYKLSYADNQEKRMSTELTATSRSAYFKISYQDGGKPILFIEAARSKPGGYIQIIPEKREVRLYNKERHDSHLGPELKNLKGYYVLRFSEEFSGFGTWSGEEKFELSLEKDGDNIGAYIEFPLSSNKVVDVKIGSSFISFDQAATNLDLEISEDADFATVSNKVKENWSHYLDKIKVNKASEEDLSIFYTALFRTLQYPREFSEYGKYYSPFDDTVHEGISYNAFSLWDTFRAEHPLLQIIAPERVDDMITSLVQMYKEGGWIPKWPNPTYTNIMIGTHADAVIADAYVNGFRGYDVEMAYQAIRKNAFTPPLNDEKYRWGDRHTWNGSYEARAGLTNYIAKGYVAEDKTDESVARTLEFALDDYCIAQMAKGLGYKDDYKILMNRSKNYRNLYDAETEFFRSKNSDGTWSDPNSGFTEGANWTYLFCVMQDPEGMVKLMGGKKKVVEMLNKTFDEGHYRHDNEPCHHYVYLYNYCDRMDIAQKRIPEIIQKNYQNRPDGLSGNDDCGQMSAWYIFSSLGFYPLIPASSEYTLGIPYFEEASINLPNGEVLQVRMNKKSNLGIIKFNGKKISKPFIEIKQMLKGGVLEFN